MSKANPTDLFALVERVVSATEAEGEEELVVPTHVARALLELARRAPRTRRGRPPVSGRTTVRDTVAVYLARRRKRELLAAAEARGEHLSADAAAWQAANESTTKSRLSASEIRSRMDRRSRR